MRTYVRRNPRATCRTAARVEAATGPIRGTLRNISLGGAFFVASRVVPVGRDVEMLIEMPGQKSMRAWGEVRYHHRYEGEGEGMGIRFVRLEQQDIARLTNWIANLLAANSPA